MAQIVTDKGQVILLDDEDLPSIGAYKWGVQKGGRTNYAYTHIQTPTRKRTLLRMHQLVMQPPLGFGVHHLNGNGLDNRKSNLRVCFHQENMQAQRLRSDNKSGYKGVCLFKPTGRWMAYITVNKKRIHLGYFHRMLDAAQAYDTAAREHFKEFAILNFPENETAAKCARKARRKAATTKTRRKA